MNNLMLVVVVLVLFVYFGGSNVPKVLRDNKEMLLGAAGGLVLCSFFGMRMEGWLDGTTMDEKANTCCNGGNWNINKRSVGPNHEPNECAMAGNQDDLNGMCERLLLAGRQVGQ